MDPVTYGSSPPPWAGAASFSCVGVASFPPPLLGAILAPALHILPSQLVDVSLGWFGTYTHPITLSIDLFVLTYCEHYSRISCSLFSIQSSLFVTHQNDSNTRQVTKISSINYKWSTLAVYRCTLNLGYMSIK